MSKKEEIFWEFMSQSWLNERLQNFRE